MNTHLPHLSDGDLRAQIDRALPAAGQASAEAHLAGCPECRARLAGLAAVSTRAGRALAHLDPLPDEAAAPADMAWPMLQSRLAAPPPPHGKDRFPMLTWLGASRARRLAAATAIVAVVAVAVAFQPVRALAGQLLGLFRVQSVMVLPVDSPQLEALGGDGALGQAVGRLFSDSMTVLHEPAPPRDVADAAEASRLAGFEVRLPVGGPTAPRLSVHDGTAFEFSVDRARVQAILEALRESAAASGGSVDGSAAPDVVLPEAIDGAKVSVAVPAGVSAEYGDCAGLDEQAGPGAATDSQARSPEAPPDFGDERSGCLMLAQMPSPEVTAPPEIDVASLAETGLRFMGFSPLEAKTFSHTVDWTSTLVLPIPRGSASSTAITVDGVDGVLLQRVGENDRPRPDYTVLWVKEGRVYVLIGASRDPQPGLALANSLP